MPRYPAISPSAVPSTSAIAEGIKPITNEIRLPYTTRVNTSWPSSSVPNQCSAVGGSFMLIRSISFGS